jgi:hypothetical protein
MGQYPQNNIFLSLVPPTTWTYYDFGTTMGGEVASLITGSLEIKNDSAVVLDFSFSLSDANPPILHGSLNGSESIIMFAKVVTGIWLKAEAVTASTIRVFGW